MLYDFANYKAKQLYNSSMKTVYISKKVHTECSEQVKKKKKKSCYMIYYDKVSHCLGIEKIDRQLHVHYSGNTTLPSISACSKT